MGRWRDAVEQAGVFVFKRSFTQREISGFCLADPVFPVIIVNNSTAFTRQIFTVLHELAHLLYGVSSVTSSDATLVDRFAAPDRAVEMACNRLAAEVLLPSDAVQWAAVVGDDLAGRVVALSSRFNVSREVVLRRLMDRQLVSQPVYRSLTQQWNAAIEDSEGSGGNYYATRAAYLGRSFLNLAFAQYRAGNVTLAELSEHLNIKARNVLKLEDYLLGRA
jgi:Zn-dependent peptidase ImmA (M78 family)